MSAGPVQSAPLPWKPWLGVVLRYTPVWLGCTLVAGALGMGYGTMRDPTWKASQPLVIRDEVSGAFERLGRFASQTELKAAQETVVEMARNSEVVAVALKELGPYRSTPLEEAWPSQKVIEEWSEKRISVRPPKGAEFGSSEVLYLTTEAETPDRAKKLCELILAQTSERLRLLRRVRADSILAELRESRDLASTRLDEVTNRVREIEKTVGSDLAELRSLAETSGGDGAVRRSLLEVQTELQQAELELQRLQSLRELLETGGKDPQQLALAGEDLLSLQPTLKRLKDGLIDAQLNRAQLSGKYQPEHPRMKSAELQEIDIRSRLMQEIDAAIGSMDPRLAVAADRVERLKQKQLNLQSRLQQLAELRTEYTNLSVQVRQRSDTLGQAEKALAEAEASRTATLSTNFVEALNLPQVNEDPEGPPASLLGIGASAAGAILGFGLVFLVAPSPAGPRFGRRWSDYGAGRRTGDGDRRAPITPEQAGIAMRLGATKPVEASMPGDATAAPLVEEKKSNVIRAVATAEEEATPITAEPVATERRRKPRVPPSNLFGV